MLEVRELRRAFGGVTAIDGVSLDVPRHRVVAVIGPNGAGKSTLFNLITGHLAADAGTVRLNGRDVTAEDWYVGGVTVDALKKAGKL